MKTFVRIAILGPAVLFLCGFFSCQSGPSSPVLASVVPSTIPVGAPATALQITGSKFTTADIAIWNSSQTLSTSYISSTALTAVVPAANLVKAGTATLFIALAQGQNQTASQPLTIVIGESTPTVTSVSPDKSLSNATSLSITVTGTNFDSSSVISFGSNALTTTCASSTSCTATVPTADYASAGTDKVLVTNTGGLASGTVNFNVVAPLAITTTTLPAGSFGKTYSATLATSGGLPPFSWAITTGSLPAGLSLGASTGTISGTPSASGSSAFTVTVTDAYGSLARRVFK